MKRLSPRIERTRRGFRLRLPPAERAVLATLPRQLREVLSGDDPAAARLFPPGYPDDPEAEEEYRRMVRDDLVAGRVGALEVMEATIEADRLTEDQLVAWLGALNDLRLILGTRLEVTEELYERPVAPDDPRAPAFALYHLSWLEEQAVEALAAGIDPAGVD